ncbi:MAG: endonuclease III domain-containing protein [Bacillota bacterium]
MLLDVYNRLYSRFGPQHWWPGDTPFEVIVGAILTQSVSWKNVALAIDALEQAGLLDPRSMRDIGEGAIALLVRSTGYYQQKARKLKSFLAYLWDTHGGELDRMFSTPPAELRRQLLGVWGLGPETVDSIMLYAGNIPSFVVDAYTVRVLTRMGLVQEGASYDEIRGFFMDNLPQDPQMYNEYHALFVHLGKHFCKKRELLCGDCPLSEICRTCLATRAEALQQGPAAQAR